jgi:hypothetical protein
VVSIHKFSRFSCIHNFSFLVVSLLATIIIWLKDLSNGGFLNMSPRKRELYTKLKDTAQIQDSTESETNEDYGSTSRRSPEATRSKYSKKNGGDDATSDCEPLLE